MILGNEARATVLNSRQSLFPTGSNDWVQNTIKAVFHIAQTGMPLLVSVGMKSWELTLFLAVKNNVPMVIVVPLVQDESKSSIQDYFSRQFNIDSQMVINWIFIEIPKGRAGWLDFQKQRDKIVIEMADTIYPISIRPKGKLHQLINDAEKSGKEVMRDFNAPYTIETNLDTTGSNELKINPEIDRILSDHIFHWTRGVHDPWPGETSFEYYNDLINSKDSYCRSASKTLIRILQENKLRASSRHMRKGIAAVSFSSLLPSKAVSLMRWRARYREMSLEPYGIAIRKSSGINVGIRKVIYGNPEMHMYLEESDRPYFQSIGKVGDWMPEMEYRRIGDIILDSINYDDISVIVRDQKEICQVKAHTNLEVHSLFLK